MIKIKVKNFKGILGDFPTDHSCPVKMHFWRDIDQESLDKKFSNPCPYPITNPNKDPYQLVILQVSPFPGADPECNFSGYAPMEFKPYGALTGLLPQSMRNIDAQKVEVEFLVFPEHEEEGNIYLLFEEGNELRLHQAGYPALVLYRGQPFITADVYKYKSLIYEATWKQNPLVISCYTPIIPLYYRGWEYAV